MKFLGSDLPTADPYLSGHGDPSWRAEHYHLELAYDPMRNHLRGTATIDAVAVDDLSRVVLDLAGLDVANVTVDGKPPAKYSARSNRLVLTLRSELPADTEFRIVIRYAGTPRPLNDRHHGEAGWEELDDGVIVAGQPHGAPTWFPCNDRPDDKATYAIAVAAPNDYTVIANGDLANKTRGSSATTWSYRMDEPMATYLATVQIGRYRERSVKGPVPIRVFLPEGEDDGFEPGFGQQGTMLKTFVNWFGPYPFSSYAAVVTADDLEIPLESQSLSTFGRNFLGDDWGSVRLVAHELAHQWFGNAVTLKRWQDIWLHEGFACYSEWLWSDASGGESVGHWAAHHHGRLTELDQDLVLADPGPELMFDDRVYKRGALTLHAVRLRVGDDAFFPLLRAWVAEHLGGSVTTEDFRAFASDHTDVDLDDLFTAWLDQTELPDL